MRDAYTNIDEKAFTNTKIVHNKMCIYIYFKGTGNSLFFLNNEEHQPRFPRKSCASLSQVVLNISHEH